MSHYDRPPSGQARGRAGDTEVSHLQDLRTRLQGAPDECWPLHVFNGSPHPPVVVRDGERANGRETSSLRLRLWLLHVPPSNTPLLRVLKSSLLLCQEWDCCSYKRGWRGHLISLLFHPFCHVGQCLLLLPHEDTDRVIPQKLREASTRHQICWPLDLRPPSL